MANKSGAQRNTARRQPYGWLGAGAVAFGIGVALAGAGTAHADDSVSDAASTAAASSARAPGNAAAGAAAKSTPRSPVATSRPAGPRQSANDRAGKRALTAANRSAPAATLRVRSAVPASAAATATAVAQSEAGDRPLRRTVVRAAAARAAAAQAAVTPAEAINAAVIDWFDSASASLAILPRGPLNDLVSGALLLVPRSLFNQLPTSRPQHYLTTLTGDLVGTLGVTDAESDPVTYRLTAVPQHGSVQVAADGTYLYTPGSTYAGTDEFAVSVGSGGFNLLAPLGSRDVAVTVKVGTVAGSGSSDSLAKKYELLNLTPYPVRLTGLVSNTADAVEVAPPVGGPAFSPGETVHFQIRSDPKNFLTKGTDTVATFTACLDADCSTTGQSWDLTFHVNPVKFSQWVGFISTGNLSGPAGSIYTVQDDSDAKQIYDVNMLLKYALVESPGSTKTLRQSDIGAEDLLSWFLANTDSKKPTIAISMTNVQFNENPPDDPGYTRQISADNFGDAPGSINKTVSSSTSTTNGSNWEVSGKASWSPIEKILGFEVAGKYGKSESETKAKTYSTTVTSTSLPWSANEILTAPPKLLVTGDAQVVLGTGADARTYSFSGVRYYFPNPNFDAPLYLIRTEPLQQKYTAADNVAPNLIGTPIPNVGFTLRDKSSTILSPTYSVGQVAQLTVSAYQGVGASADKTGDPRTIYTTSNPAVATVDTTGALTAMGPGTATITAIYKWAIPYGNGTVRNDYVLATINVKVT